MWVGVASRRSFGNASGARAAQLRATEHHPGGAKTLVDYGGHRGCSLCALGPWRVPFECRCLCVGGGSIQEVTGLFIIFLIELFIFPSFPQW